LTYVKSTDTWSLKGTLYAGTSLTVQVDRVSQESIVVVIKTLSSTADFSFIAMHKGESGVSSTPTSLDCKSCVDGGAYLCYDPNSDLNKP
jgi:hypothetical protein